MGDVRHAVIGAAALAMHGDCEDSDETAETIDTDRCLHTGDVAVIGAHD